MTTIDDLEARVRARAAQHGDRNYRAAVQLACESILLYKVAPFVEADGFIPWDEITVHLIEGTGWSGGEIRLAKIACSLSGLFGYVGDDIRGQADIAAWALSECLWGLDDRNMTAALIAIHIAATGQPPAHPATADNYRSNDGTSQDTWQDGTRTAEGGASR